MADPQGDGVVEVIGPDEQSYHFPAGTTKDQAVTYFKSKGIGMTHQTASSGFIPTSGTVAPTPPSPPSPPDSSSYGGEIVRGLARGTAGLVTAPFAAMKPRNDSEVQYGPVGRLLLHMGQDFMGGLQAGKQARDKARVSGEGTAGQTLATLENYPVVGGLVRKAEEGGPSTFSPQSVGATAEAIPSVLAFRAGKRAGEPPSDVAATNKLSFATNAAPKDLAHVLPDIRETVGNAPIRTVGDVADAIQNTGSRLDQTFNQHLAQIGGQQIVPTQIADALEAKARTLPRTAVAEKQALTNAAVQYRQPWTLQELNAERMYRNGLGKGFYGKSDSGQMAAMRSNADTMVDQTVADATRDVLYDEMQRRLPHSGVDFQALKQKQGSMLDILTDLNKQLDRLDRAQAKEAGAPMLTKETITANVHPGGVTPRVHGIQKFIPGRGPMGAANVAARTAFGPTPAATLRGAAIRSLPASSLITGTRTAVPPPPSDNTQ